ncbi:MAG: leucyl aminopeptidase [Chloroflexota bacterium]|nr:leucyl aminopeptidase [Chloroflexota bacterium]
MALTITTKSGDALTAAVDALILPVRTGAGIPGGLDGNDRFGGELAPVLDATGFTGKAGQVAAVPTFGKLPARTLVLTGTGDGGDPALRGESLRRAYGAAIKRAQEQGARTVAALLPDGADADAVSAVVEGISLSQYRFARYKSSGEASKAIESVELWSSGSVPEGAVTHGQAIAAGVALARDLVNTISNDKTPPEIAAWAQRVARESGLPCEVLDEKALASGGYNSILAVGKGSAAPPRLIEMVYEPKGGAKKTIALVGKTITFDSGGLDLKTQDGMYAMKTDMGGGAAVLGAMHAIAQVKPNVRVIGIMTAAENMPSGTAMRPSDVVTALSGKTFEIGNTDAEGRMVLADAVTHAARAGADEIIDLATLTGAKMVALGSVAVAVMGNDQGLVDRFLTAAGNAGERVWQLPTWDEYKEQLKSDIADLKSTGGRGGGAITAALFIGEFVEGKPWIHLDIAGSAATAESGPYTPKGATGVMVRSLVQYVEEAGK